MRDRTAPVQDEHPVDDLAHDALDVLNQENRDAPGMHGTDQLDHLVELAADQSGRHLVQHEQLGTGGEGAGHLKALEVEDAQRASQPGRLRFELAQCQDLVQFGGAHPGACGHGAHAYVVSHREPAERARHLVGERDAQPGNALGRQPVEGVPAETDAALVRAVHAGDGLEERALAGPVRTDDRDGFTPADSEVDPVKGRNAPEALAQPSDLKIHPGFFPSLGSCPEPPGPGR